MRIADIKGEILKNEPMCNHTSFGIGGPADILAYPVDFEDLKALLKSVKDENLNYFILGSGTNLLVRDGGFQGVVICLKRMNHVAVEREYHSLGGTFASLFAQAGAPISKLLAIAVDEGFTGLEFAAGIPGSIGGAVYMNAGTTLGEIGDIIDSATLISPEGMLVTKDRNEMGFGYRTSSIQEGYCVLDIRVILRRGDKDKIRTRVLELLMKRKQRQPWEFPNAGSIFRNPNEESAGNLIESAGLKGRAVGKAQISEKHANFIVNFGKSRASDVIKLMNIVQQTVLEVHGVRLEPEIKIIGKD
ncbi:MAG TPA: UDP-N-acetylmuramate dehydrogenase [Nitrospirota bacterium]|nr:UDP-N-acetylmuramate dehydrogenase [Nitrospirota bacterium]